MLDLTEILKNSMSVRNDIDWQKALLDPESR